MKGGGLRLVRKIYFSGYRSYEMGIFTLKDERIPFIKKAIRQRLLAELDQGLEWLLISGQLGAEMWAGQEALNLRQDYKQLKLAMIMPYMDIESRWKEENQALFYQLKDQVDYAAYTSTSPYSHPGQLQANQAFLIRHSTKALLLYDRAYPGKCQHVYDLIVKRQATKPYELELISMMDLQDLVDEDQWRQGTEGPLN